MANISKYSALAAAVALAVQAAADDLSLKTDGGLLPSSWEWNDASAWEPEGGSLENANLSIGGVAESAVNSTITGGMTLGNIDITVGDNGNSSNIFKASAEDADVNFKTINISNGGTTQSVTLYSSSGKWIGESINIISDGAHRQTVKLAPKSPRLTLSGGINLVNNKATDGLTIEGQTDIAGAITMKAAGSSEGARLTLNMWNMSIGGFSDGGVKANHYISFNWGGTVSLTNSSDYSWRGGFGIYSGNDDISISKGGAGAQKFEVTSITNHFNNIYANEGLLEINASAISSSFANKLILNGGTFKNVGDISFGAIDFKQGSIMLGNDSGTIIVAGDAVKGSEKISLDFAELTQSGEYTLLEIAGALSGFDTGDALVDFNLINLVEGANAELAWNGNSLVLSYTVPEPSIAAAALGAIALGFAALRRRK